MMGKAHMPCVVYPLTNCGEHGSAGKQEAHDSDGAQGSSGFGYAIHEVEQILCRYGDVLDDSFHHTGLLFSTGVRIAQDGYPDEEKWKKGE